MPIMAGEITTQYKHEEDGQNFNQSKKGKLWGRPMALVKLWLAMCVIYGS